MSDLSKSLVQLKSNNQVALMTKMHYDPNKTAKKKVILDEESFVKDLETIIERDFFPDLEKLKVQQAYIKALETYDIAALRELHSKYSIHRNANRTASIRTNKSELSPTTFETPDLATRETPRANANKTKKEDDDDDDDDPCSYINEEPPKKRLASEYTLDKYLAKNTSEDNLSFETIMHDAEKKDNLKMHKSWLFDQEKLTHQNNETALAIPNFEKQMIENQNTVSNTGGVLDTWTYTSKNTLMYIPEGAPLTYDEKLEVEKNAKIIKHENTRFNVVPFDFKKPNAIALNNAGDTKIAQLNAKFGVDGKELMQKETPKVNGYAYVDAIPSPIPGRLLGDESPMMTWGEIEGTPFRLDGSSTPYSSYHHGAGPEFKIPDVPEREKIALSLEEKANAARRKSKLDALKHVQRNLSGQSVDSSKGSLTDRINVMSPAAQRLLSSRLNIRSNSLNRSLSRDNTPSPSVSVQGFSPSIKYASPNPSPSGNQKLQNSLKSTLKKSISDSLTDNLLKLPKKS